MWYIILGLTSLRSCLTTFSLVGRVQIQSNIYSLSTLVFSFRLLTNHGTLSRQRRSKQQLEFLSQCGRRRPLCHPFRSHQHHPSYPSNHIPQRLQLGNHHGRTVGNSVLRLPHRQHQAAHERGLVYRLVHSDPPRTTMDQCVCLHGYGADGVQFHFFGENPGCQGLEVWIVVCTSRYLVSCIGVPTSHPLNHALTFVYSAFLVQATGASMASGNNIPTSQTNRGLHIYMGGVGLQQLFVLCFIGLAYKFQREMMRDLPSSSQRPVLRLLYVLYAVLTLITVSPHPMFSIKGDG